MPSFSSAPARGLKLRPVSISTLLAIAGCPASSQKYRVRSAMKLTVFLAYGRASPVWARTVKKANKRPGRRAWLQRGAQAPSLTSRKARDLNRLAVERNEPQKSVFRLRANFMHPRARGNGGELFLKADKAHGRAIGLKP